MSVQQAQQDISHYLMAGLRPLRQEKNLVQYPG